MTFFLNGKEPTEARGLGTRPATFAEGVAAAASTEWRDADMLFQRDREVAREKVARARPLAERVGIGALNNQYQAANTKTGQDGYTRFNGIEGQPTTVQEFYDLYGESVASDTVLQAARQSAATQPDQWSDVDLSEDGINATVTARRTAEDRDEAAILAMSPSPAIAGFIGATGAMIADPVNIAMIPLGGGGGSFLRFLGREAFLGMAAEVPSLPARFRTAEELGKQAPDVAETLALGAVGGAVLGGVFEAGARGLRYYQSRGALPAETVDPIITEAGIGAAEDAIIAGDNPLKAVAEVMGRDSAFPNATENMPEPMQPAPIIRPEAFERAAQEQAPAETPVVEGGIPQSKQEVVPSQNPVVPDGEMAAAISALDDAVSADSKFARPLISWIQQSAPPNKAQVRAAAKKGKALPIATDLRIDPNGTVGQELKARGINSKTAPGLFKKGGIKDLDNMVASEMEEAFPGIMAATGTSFGDNYLNSDGLIDLIGRDFGGDSSWLQTRKAVQDAEAARVHAERMESEPEYAARYGDEVQQAVEDAYASKARADAGFYMDPDRYTFDDPDGLAVLEADFDAYVADKGVYLYPEERAQILETLKANGGDAEYLIEAVAGRKIDAAQIAHDGGESGPVPFGDEPEGTFASAADTSADPFGESQTAPGNAAAIGSGNPQPQRVGGQTFIPGTDRDATGLVQRQQSEMAARQQQSMLRRGDQVRVEGEDGNLFSREQMDMFSDPTDPKVRPMQQSMIESLRDSVEVDGDFTVDLMDGRGTRNASDMIREMDEDADFTDILDQCGKRRTE